MADTKISALGDIGALADGDKVAVVDASDTSVSKSATMTELKTYMRPEMIMSNSGALDQADMAAITIQTITSNNSDIPTTSVVTQLTASTMGVGWWLVEYFIVWQSGVTTTGITFTCSHTGTAADSVWTREDPTSSATALATVGVAMQAANLGVAGSLPSNWASRTNPAVLGPNAGVDVINVDQLSRITGIILVTASGDMLLRANSEVASTATRICAGTTARYTRLS